VTDGVIIYAEHSTTLQTGQDKSQPPVTIIGIRTLRWPLGQRSPRGPDDWKRRDARLPHCMFAAAIGISGIYELAPLMSANLSRDLKLDNVEAMPLICSSRFPSQPRQYT
jgi:hypothetical protein